VYGAPGVVSEIGTDVERVDGARNQRVDKQHSLVRRDDLRRRLGKYKLGVYAGVRAVFLHAVVLDLRVPCLVG